MPSTVAEKNPSRRRLLTVGSAGALSVLPSFSAAGSPPAGRAMRSPSLPAPSGRKALPTPPSAAVIALNRMGFGPRPGDIEAFEALGANDDQRLLAYVDQQLNPDAIDDSAFETRVAAAGFTTLDKTIEQLWADHVVADPDYEIRMAPLHEIENLTFLRATYSRKQLLEVLADFWHNHFNVYADWETGPLWVHYDRDVIRTHALGNFRAMLQADAMSPTMLYYLDNYLNSADGPNENYSRELFELHTMGTDSYYGLIPQDQVPLDDQGVPVGWVDQDIIEASRCLTGWTIDAFPWDPDFGNTGAFIYQPSWHDNGQKTVLGNNLPAAQPELKDGLDVLDALAAHPATGRFIAGKLCRRLIGDTPPQQVIDDAAAVFTAQVAAPDQLTQVVRTILLSTAFRQTWADKIKRPFEITVGTLRAAELEMPFRLDDNNSNTFFYLYSHTSQTLFGHRPPNGYPDEKADWQSTTPRVMTWRLCNWLVDARDDNDALLFDAFALTPPEVRSSNALADFWINRVLARPMPDGERQEIVDFIAQGRNPDLDWPLEEDEQVQDRLRAMVGLIFMSPTFLWR